MHCHHAICTTDPISGHVVSPKKRRFSVVEGDGCHDLTIYFESEENKRTYLEIAVERPEASVRVNLGNAKDEGIEQG